MANKYAVLKEYFGHSRFREGQEQVVDAILRGEDVLCVMPTGAGKSICYQVPALLFDGITLVVSPLISLMKDQVTALVQNGVAAAYLNSSLTLPQYRRALYNMQCGKYKLVYITPERLATVEFLEVCRSLSISFLAIDEAHCVSQWGQDFRPQYLNIAGFVECLKRRPIVGAFTATATAEVKRDIETALRLRAPFQITTGFDRPNLRFSVLRAKSKNDALLEQIKAHPNAAGIVYCATRKAVEEVCALLNSRGIAATMYHAGLPEEVRRENQEDFAFDRKPVMVATNAFGMGIDKSNVSFVVHYNMPKNIESYYQEAGRAGRDGEPADCVLLYSPGDVHTNQFLIEHSEPNPALTEEQQRLVRQKDHERLKRMTFYSTTNTCLRSFMLGYFGEKAANYCGNCSNCLTQFEEADVTTEAQKLLSCIKRTGGRFGKKMICDILRGSKNERLLRMGLDGQSTYGLLADRSEQRIREILDFLEFEGYVVSVGEEYPVLRATDKADEVLFAQKALTMKVAKPKAPAAATYSKGTVHTRMDPDLFAELRALRKHIANEKHMAAYLIFSDSTLVDMCLQRPQTEEEFLAVSGVGKTKCALYGKAFLEVLKK